MFRCSIFSTFLITFYYDTIFVLRSIEKCFSFRATYQTEKLKCRNFRRNIFIFAAKKNSFLNLCSQTSWHKFMCRSSWNSFHLCCVQKFFFFFNCTFAQASIRKQHYTVFRLSRNQIEARILRKVLQANSYFKIDEAKYNS